MKVTKEQLKQIIKEELEATGPPSRAPITPEHVQKLLRFHVVDYEQKIGEIWDRLDRLEGGGDPQ